MFIRVDKLRRIDTKSKLQEVKWADKCVIVAEYRTVCFMCLHHVCTMQRINKYIDFSR